MITLSTNTWKYGDPYITASTDSDDWAHYIWKSSTGVTTPLNTPHSQATTIVPANETKSGQTIKVYEYFYGSGLLEDADIGMIIDLPLNSLSTTSSSYVYGYTPSYHILGTYVANRVAINTNGNTKIIVTGTEGVTELFWEVNRTIATAKAFNDSLITVSNVNPGDFFSVEVEGVSVKYYINDVLKAEYVLEEPIDDVYFGYGIKKAGGISFSTGTGNLYIHNAAGHAVESATFNVEAVFPWYPNYTYDYVSNSNIISSTAEDLTRRFKRKSPITKPLQKTMTMKFEEREKDEILLVKEFFDFHQRDIPFWFFNYDFNEWLWVTAENDFGVTALEPNAYTYMLNIREI